MNGLAVIGSLTLVSVLGAGLARAQDQPPAAVELQQAAASQNSRPFAERFPNVVLKTHEGKSVRFYDDLLAGKIVMINFMYVTCEER